MGANLEYILKYQELLKNELIQLKNREQPIGIPCNECDDIKVSKLAEKGWLIKVNFGGEYRYVTRHGLLINTLLNLKWVTLRHTREGFIEKVLPGERQVIDYDIDPPTEEWILLPTTTLDNDKLRSWLIQANSSSFANVSVGDLLRVFKKTLEFAWSPHAVRAPRRLAERTTVSLTPFQRNIVDKYINVMGSLTKKALVITAPTGAGKTKTLQILSLVHLLNNDIIILIYPRKSLAKQELRDYLRIICWLNKEVREGTLKQHGVEGCFIALDDGDTPRASKVEEELQKKGALPFRGLDCPICNVGKLTYVKDAKSGAILVECDGGCDFNKYISKYLLATRESIECFSLNLERGNRRVPLIYITNIWSLSRRVLDPNYWPILERASTIFLDEAHVYSHYFGENVHYVLKEFRSINPEVKFVLASATLANPQDFASDLLGLKRSEIELADYGTYVERMRQTSSVIRKLVVRIYALPHPEMSVDTVIENFAVILHLWCLRYGHQGIVFIDNKDTIERIYGYIVEIIYDRRKLAEIQGLLRYKLIPEEIVPQEILRDSDRVVNELKKSIGISYSEYNRRNEVEREFLKGHIKLLLSTSTVELGINVENVAVILQHSFPISPESFVQRVGRAGRTDRTMYVSLGIMVLPHSMLGIRYVHDTHFREEVNKFVQKVGKNSYAVMFQHAISALMLEILRRLKYGS